MFRKALRAACAFLLACAFLTASAAPAGAAQAVSYDPGAAIRYAKEHARSEKGLCATFVSHCLTAGGVSVKESGAGSLLKRLEKTGAGRIISQPEASDLHAGDVVGVICRKHSTDKSYWGLHVILVSQAGSNAIRYYAVNNLRENAKMKNAKLEKYNEYFSCKKCGSKKNTEVVAFCFDDAVKTSAAGTNDRETLTEQEKQALTALCVLTCELPDFGDAKELNKSERLSLLHTAYWYDGLRYAGDFSQSQYYGENCEVSVDAANQFIKSVLGIGIPNVSESGTFDVIVGSVVTCDGDTYTVEASDFNAFAYLGNVESLGGGVFKVPHVRCAFDEQPTAEKFKNADYLIVKRSNAGYGFTVLAKNEPLTAAQVGENANQDAANAGGESPAEAFVRDAAEEVSGFLKNWFGRDETDDALASSGGKEEAGQSSYDTESDGYWASDGAYENESNDGWQDWESQASHSVYESPASDFLYTISNGEATVTKYIGSAEEVVIPGILGGASVTVIGPSAFEQNATLEYVYVPYGVTEISNKAFLGCRSLIKADLPEGLMRIAPGAFSKCIRLREAIIPEGVRSIGKYAFSACDALSAVSLPDTLREMVAGAFSGCVSLPRIDVPAGLQSIPEDAFAGCTSLRTAVIPVGVVVYKGAFRNCNNLTIITPEGTSAYKFAEKFGIPTATSEY